jgi:hypothetical protein
MCSAIINNLLQEEQHLFSSVHRVVGGKTFGCLAPFYFMARNLVLKHSMKTFADRLLIKHARGLFQTNEKVGLLFPLMANKMFGDGKILYVQIPTFNDVRGEIRALELMKDPDFVEWAIDPWSGKINVSFES